MDAAFTAVNAGLPLQAGFGDSLGLKLLEHLERVWTEPDDGIWEVRGPRRHFTHSKVMAWVAFDRAVRMAEARGRGGADVDRWRAARESIHAEVCTRAGVRRAAASCSTTAASPSTPAFS